MKKNYYLFLCVLVGLFILLFILLERSGPSTIEDTEKQKVFVGGESEDEGCIVHPYSGEPLEFGDIEQDLRGGVKCFFHLQNNDMGYFFELKPDVELNTISHIDVVSDGVVLQMIDTSDLSQPVYQGQEFFTVIDANFDHYKDISLVLWSGATGNAGHGFWLFNPEKNIFIYNEELSSLTSPVFDVKQKKIFSHANGGMAGCIYGDAWYTFNNAGVLEISEEEIQDYDNSKNIFVRTKSIYRDGVVQDQTSKEVACGE